MLSGGSDNNTDAGDLENHMRLAPHRQEEQPSPRSALAPPGAGETTTGEERVPPVLPEPQLGSAEENRDTPRGQDGARDELPVLPGVQHIFQ